MDVMMIHGRGGGENRMEDRDVKKIKEHKKVRGILREEVISYDT